TQVHHFHISIGETRYIMNEDTVKLISIPLATCLSTFCLWLLCLASPPKLEGHWHVYDPDGNIPSSVEYIQTIDFHAAHLINMEQAALFNEKVLAFLHGM
ncbi:MAG: hypothetical protein KTR30_25105, partial [Saprospiraceae bacterium]|nr:hypothetical protein [Saprospiraceae bacterium]